MIFISVNTQLRRKEWGWPDKRFKMGWILHEKFCKSAKGHTIVVEKSTLPVKTAQTIKDILDSSKLIILMNVEVFQFVKSWISSRRDS